MNASAFNAVPKSLPHGVVGLLGWANRVLIVVYCAWAIIAARAATQRGGAI